VAADGRRYMLVTYLGTAHIVSETCSNHTRRQAQLHATIGYEGYSSIPLLFLHLLPCKVPVLALHSDNDEEESIREISRAIA